MGYLTENQHAYYSGNGNAHGSYQFLTMAEIIDNFTATYVGDGKILQGVLKADVSFHAHRALAELHYDTLRSCKSQEITLPPSLTMVLPQDYVNYTKIVWSDNNGVERIIYPVSKTSNPQTIQQDADGEYLFTRDHSLESEDVAHLAQDHVKVIVKRSGGAINIPANFDGIFEAEGLGEGMVVINGPADAANPADESWIKVGMEVRHKYLPPRTTVATITHVANTNAGEPAYVRFTLSNAMNNEISILSPSFEFVDNTGNTTWGKFKGSTTNQVSIDESTTTNLSVDADNYFQNSGQRYGMDPQYAQANGSFFIDCNSGKIHFSSNLNGKTIILRYISDGLGTDEEMIVHKFAEEAMYKSILFGCLSARAGVPAGLLQMAKRERFSEIRKAKIRLSNIKIEEITQIFRGKSKFIKH